MINLCNFPSTVSVNLLVIYCTCIIITPFAIFFLEEDREGTLYFSLKKLIGTSTLFN